ncbi:selenocysteine-specific translation elongation factor [Flexistipes sinusarabici DSM 4947]|uniref:Selenocysteine-specific elongation factor n=1 Tax=Flexistipes sinusarabici (strain ATCC 49648 / DSM 4947 / MAS 10) TaxID=717231 RepID=F8E526_FLESM|nr:selenocysteine-specific translation elongation factor [Flexistipes sinusarabici]AEI15662.1 selenocysteine-specific translation elongation factor [Flexistipes sinusarabici DSM 4947]
MGRQNVIVGTAGHIDHGKSALVERLTGVHPDRFKEEQERGITLDLGFAALEIDETTISFVDVPGHEKLIRNMIAGATGIDIILFAVDATEGIKPQTIEHADILSVLNIETLIVVLTKADKVSEALLNRRLSEAREFFNRFTYPYKRFLTVSIYEQHSIDNLKKTLYECSGLISSRYTSHDFLMRIDRSFSVKGAGTVVTGSCITGQIKTGDDIEILPAGIQTKVKNIQVHSKNSLSASAGDRAALNVTGVDKNNVHRGDIAAAPKVFSPAASFYARLKTFSSISKKDVIKHNKSYRFLIGTYAGEAKIILLGKKSLNAGESALCKIVPDKSYTPLFGEAFFLRSLSPQITVAGGKVLSITNFGLAKNNLLTLLSCMENGKAEEAFKVLETNIEGTFDIPTLIQFTDKKSDEIKHLIKKYFISAGRTVTPRKYFSKITDMAKEEIYSGKTLSLSGYHKYFKNSENIWKIFRENLIRLAEKNGYTYENEKIFKKRKSEHEKLADEIYEKMSQDVSLSNAANLSSFLNISEKAAANALTILANKGKVKKLDEKNFIRTDIFDNFIQLAVKTAKKEQYIDLKKAKTIIKAPRKILIPLIEQLDKTGLFTNKDNKRYLKGDETAEF